MNYSRAGSPTATNKPGVDKRIDDKMDALMEEQKELELNIIHYTLKIELHDAWEKWYERRLAECNKRLGLVEKEMCNATGAKLEPSEGTKTKAEKSGGESAPPAKEKVTSAKVS